MSENRLIRIEKVLVALVDADMWLKPEIRELVQEIRLEIGLNPYAGGESNG